MCDEKNMLIDVNNSRSNRTPHQGYRELLSTSQHSRNYCTIQRSSKPPDRAIIRHPWLSRSLQRSLGPLVSSPSPLHYHWNKKTIQRKEREKYCRWRYKRRERQEKLMTWLKSSQTKIAPKNVCDVKHVLTSLTKTCTTGILLSDKRLCERRLFCNQKLSKKHSKWS